MVIRSPLVLQMTCQSSSLISFLLLISVLPVSASAASASDLAPATYGARCRFFDKPEAMAIGQAFVGRGNRLQLAYNVSLVASRANRFTPEAYLLETRDGNRYLNVTKNQTIFSVLADSYTYLGVSSNRMALMSIQKYLKPTSRQDLVITPCFSKRWNGRH